MEGEDFLLNVKHQCHLFQWIEWVYGAQHWKETRLLYESMFVLIFKWTFALKNGEKRSFSFETKASIIFIPMRRMINGAQSY